jgi:4'-phosphopantetheinyl transferase
MVITYFSWPSRFPIPPLANDTVHLWEIPLFSINNISLNRLCSYLSIDERKRAEAFRFKEDRVRYQVTRGITRSILGDYLKHPPSKLLFGFSVDKKPFLHNLLPSIDIRFNYSHSNAYAIIGLTVGNEIGVDIEKIRFNEDLDTMAPMVLSNREMNYYLQLQDKYYFFYQTWVRKEALAKASGVGLDDSIIKNDVLGPSPLLLTLYGKSASSWRIEDVRCVKGYCAAVCTEMATEK